MVLINLMEVIVSVDLIPHYWQEVVCLVIKANSLSMGQNLGGTRFDLLDSWS